MYVDMHIIYKMVRVWQQEEDEIHRYIYMNIYKRWKKYIHWEIYMYIYIYTHINNFVLTCTTTPAFVCTHINKFVLTCTTTPAVLSSIYIYRNIHIYVYVYTHTHKNIYLPICASVHEVNHSLICVWDGYNQWPL